MKTRTLIVDDERLIRTSLEKAFAGLGHQVEAAASVEEALFAMSRTRFDACILDLKLGGGSGLDVLQRLMREAPETQVIVITAHASVETAVEAVRMGACDFVKKPFELDELIATVENAVRTRALERRVAYHEGRERSKVGDSIVPGRSAAMKRLDSEIGQVGPQPVPVILIHGETGSGKALVARRLHFASSRAAGPFVELNAAAIPETLIESELFGHERGAFSDARERKLGLVEIADGGTLFLDEIGDLDATLQTKLLRVLQDGTFERLGSQVALTSHARVIAATSKPVAPNQPGTTMREDLFYRIGVVTIDVPPLRDRRSDVPLLVQTFLVRSAGLARAVSEDAMQKLAAYRWPGNVRELQNAIERACVMSSAEVLDAADFAIPDSRSDSTGGDDVLDLRQATARLERELILRALARAGGNRAEAARLLGIARPQLYAKMHDLQIEGPGRRK